MRLSTFPFIRRLNTFGRSVGISNPRNGDLSGTRRLCGKGNAPMNNPSVRLLLGKVLQALGDE
jgi:hypothetical protein